MQPIGVPRRLGALVGWAMRPTREEWKEMGNAKVR